MQISEFLKIQTSLVIKLQIFIILIPVYVFDHQIQIPSFEKQISVFEIQISSFKCRYLYLNADIPILMQISAF